MSGIALVVPRLSGGGAEFVAAQWAQSLAARGKQVTVIATHAETGSADAGPDGVTIVHARANGFAARVRALRRRLVELSPEVVVALMPHWNVLTLLAARGLPTRTVISGRNVEGSLVGSHDLTLRAEILLARALYRRADAYVAISHPVAAEAIAKYRIRPSRVWVVPNPSTAKVGAVAPRADRSEPLTLVVPARIVAQKRPELAIEAGRVLQRRGHDVRVEFFGTGPLQAGLERHAASLGVPVRFRGWVGQWFEHAPSNAVVLLPSVCEGFGNVLVEAAAVGVPSVASSRALGVADAIVPGLTGELAMDDTAEAFADAVERAARLPLGEDISRWLERFSPETSADRLESVLASVLDQGVR